MAVADVEEAGGVRLDRRVERSDKPRTGVENMETTLPSLGLGTFRLKGELAMGAESGPGLGYRTSIEAAQMYENGRRVGAALDADTTYPVTRSS